MKDEESFRPRPAPLKRRSKSESKLFLNQMHRRLKKAGRIHKQGNKGTRRGRGRAAALLADMRVSSKDPKVVVKTRYVTKSSRRALTAHLAYLRREGVSRNGEAGQLFSKDTDRADTQCFTRTCSKDRYHFRFIISPEKAQDLKDLKGYTRKLVHQLERDLGTELDWLAVDHWNTQHPHVHIVVRGTSDRGDALHIHPDYLSKGIRARAEHLQSLELRRCKELKRHNQLER